MYILMQLFLVNNLLHDAQLQSVTDYLQQVAYNVLPQETETPL